VLADAVGWRWAFWLLVPGPVVGAIAMRAFGRRQGVPPRGATPPGIAAPPPAINEPR
jgi:predicted MFS family arabinose efflux permease